MIARGKLLELGKREKARASSVDTSITRTVRPLATPMAAHLYGGVEVHAPGTAPTEVGGLTVDHAGRPAARSDQGG